MEYHTTFGLLLTTMAPSPHNLERLPTPPRFSGKPSENFDEWEKKFRNYMGLSDHKFDIEMRWATKQPAEISYAGLSVHDDDLSAGECRQRSMTLYYNLSHLLEGNAFVIMDQLAEDNDMNGYEAWRKLSTRYVKSSTQSALTTLISIVNTKFPDDINFEAILSKWEREIAQFENP